MGGFLAKNTFQGFTPRVHGMAGRQVHTNSEGGWFPSWGILENIGEAASIMKVAVIKYHPG